MKEASKAWWKADVASYDDNLAMAHIQGCTLRLKDPRVDEGPHLFLLVHQGELYLTVNGDRIGFEEPTYVDFLSEADTRMHGG